METSNTQPEVVETNDNQDKVVKKTKQKWSLKKKLTVIIGTIVVLIIALVLIANTATSAPLKVSDELLTDIQAGNATAAYNLLADDTKASVTSDDMKATVDQISPILTGKPSVQSKEVSAESGKNTTAKIVYEIAGSDKLTYTVTVNLVQKNDAWKVSDFTSDKK